MPTYYFHFSDGRERRLDPEGTRLPDEEAVWYHAVRSARDLIGAELVGEPIVPGSRFEIEDEEGVPVLALPIEEVALIAT
jgi:hypothetical protein